jgi:N-acetylneuraminic acid mutarotase
VIGGSNPQKLPAGKVAAFSPAGGAGVNGTWAPVAAMGSMREEGRAASLGGYIYHVGGSHLDPDYPLLNSTLRYSPSTDSWTRMAGIPFSVTDPKDAPDGSGIGFHSVVALGGYLYSIGGTNATTSLASTWRYDPKADSWKQMASMENARCYVAAAVLGGKIYAVGGSLTPAGPGGPGGGPGALASFEVYDPASDSWTLSKSITVVARMSHALAVVNGVLFALGGEDGGARSISFDTVERYDVAAEKWSLVSPMILPRSQASAGVVGGQLYAVGGYNDLTDVGWTSTVERYNPEADSWMFVASFPLERQYPAVAVL